jgi:predicted transcriptional regulator
MTLKENCIKLVEQDQLNKPNRKAHIIHKKAYLAFKLRNYAMTWNSIGEILGLTHASVIHLVNNATYWEQTKDNMYLEDTKLYRQEIENLEATPEDRNLEKDVLECESYKKLERIKERISKKYYI